MKFDYLQNDELGSYVYALRDPRDNEIFYIGKAGGRESSGNTRVLDHYNEANDCARNSSPPKSKHVARILEILKAGQSFDWFVIRRGLRDEEEALNVEAAIIDLLRFSSPGSLLNEQSGHGRDKKGLLRQEEVYLLAAKYIDLVNVPPSLIGSPIFLFNIEKGLKELGDPFEATRKAWILGQKFVNVAAGSQIAVGHVKGISRGAWKIDSWHRDQNDSRRWAFEKTDMDPDSIKFLFPKNFLKILGHSAIQGYRNRGGFYSIRLEGQGRVTILRGSREKLLELNFSAEMA